MAGSKQGGLKAAETNKLRYGNDFYTVLARAGGSAKAKKPKGFAADPERASRAGRKGGLRSVEKRLAAQQPADPTLLGRLLAVFGIRK